MADVTKTTDDLFRGRMVALVGAFGSQPTDELGFKDRDKGCEVTTGYEETRFDVEEYAGSVDVIREPNKLTVATDLQQITATTLSYAYGISSSTLLLGGGRRYNDPFSARLVGSLRNKRPIHLYTPKVMQMAGDTSSVFKVTEKVNLPFAYEALDSSAGMGRFALGMTVEDETLATGVATITTKATIDSQIVWMVLTSESDKADALTSIAATSALAAADDGRIIRIQPADGHAITVTHGATIILKGAANIVMDQPGDWIDLYYTFSSTTPTWTEICHYLAP